MLLKPKSTQALGPAKKKKDDAHIASTAGQWPPEALTGKPAKKIPSQLTNFDLLPDAAHVRQPVVAALYGCSPATVWRGVKAGRIPAPVKFSPKVSAWNVGALRRAMGKA
jgi:predicted DNA-binding transcriptional regulator AlpA